MFGGVNIAEGNKSSLETSSNSLRTAYSSEAVLNARLAKPRKIKQPGLDGKAWKAISYAKQLRFRGAKELFTILSWWYPVWCTTSLTFKEGQTNTANKKHTHFLYFTVVTGCSLDVHPLSCSRVTSSLSSLHIQDIFRLLFPLHSTICLVSPFGWSRSEGFNW